MFTRAASVLILSMCAGLAATPENRPFNPIAGTQAIGGRYQFTGETKLLESARLIQSLGSNIIKFALSNEAAFGPEKGNVPARPAGIATLRDLAANEPSHRAVFDMPFGYYLLWVYPLTSATQAQDFAPADHERQYQEVYDLACHLLRTYNHSGKSFYFGHWEGDWHLRPQFDPAQELTSARKERFTEWLRVRQKAVDDAKRDVPHQGVWIWNYTEVNLVARFVDGGPCLTNDILPDVDVDYVSYSSYDALQGDIRANLIRSLNHIESKLRPKAGVPGKRVLIGEYGFPATRFSPQEQNRKSLEVMMAGIEWGCPFVLYWELYCNEVENGKPAGFWMIDDRNGKQPVWTTYERYNRWIRDYIAGQPGPVTDDSAFRTAAVGFLRSLSAP
jgi:hypothetical protein